MQFNQEIETWIAEDLAEPGRYNTKSREGYLREYYANPNRCKMCGSVIRVPHDKSIPAVRTRKFCSSKCNVRYRYKEGRSLRTTCEVCGKPIKYKGKYGICYRCYVKIYSENTINSWLETGDTGSKGYPQNVPDCIRDYILKEQDNKCQVCGMPTEWQGKPIVFILDHVDGNAANNHRENLRMVCPNCDSQLPTYKSKNKHSARSKRRTEYQKQEQSA